MHDSGKAAGATPRRGGPAGEYVGLLAVLVALVVLFSLLSDRFLAARTFVTIGNQIPDLLVVAVGMTYVLIIAGIDLSVGSVLGLAGALLGLAMADGHWPLPAAAAAAVGAGLLCGWLNGAIAERWAVPSFIVTLGMLEIGRGCAYLATDSTTKYIGAAVEWIGAPLPGVRLSPAFFAALALVAAGQLVLSRTVFGRHMVAIGTNEQAVRLSGINPRPLKIAVFAIAGALAGLGAVFQVSRLSSADPNAGVGMELAAIAAVVIGGTSLMGGRGSVVRSFLGVLIIAVLQTGLAQIGAKEPSKRIVTGAVIVAAAILDALRSRAAGRGYPLLRRLFRRDRVAE